MAGRQQHEPNENEQKTLFHLILYQIGRDVVTFAFSRRSMAAFCCTLRRAAAMSSISCLVPKNRLCSSHSPSRQARSLSGRLSEPIVLGWFPTSAAARWQLIRSEQWIAVERIRIGRN